MCYGANARTLEKLEKFEWDALLSYLEQTQNITEFWMPVKRADNNNYHPFIWQLPGRRWGISFKKNNGLINETNFGENCVKLVTDKNRRTIYKVTHCENILYGVCVFKEKFVVKSTCRANFAAIRYKPNVCYGLAEHDRKIAINLTEYMENAATIKRIVNFIDVSGNFGLLEAETIATGAANIKHQLIVNEKGLFGLSTTTGNYEKLISWVVFCGCQTTRKVLLMNYN